MLLTRRKMVFGLLSCPVCGQVSSAGAETGKEDSDDWKTLCAMKQMPGNGAVESIRDGRPEAIRVIGWITDLIGMRSHIRILEADFKIDNVARAVTRGSQRYVVYDAKWFTFEDNRVSWYSIYVLGHEIGHHIYGHTHGFKPEQHRAELDADRFGGWVVARLGGRLDQAVAFTRVFSEKGSKSHPPRHERIAAIQEGWQAGKNVMPR